MIERIDLERCRRGMKQLRIEGSPRASLIAAAIEAIQKAPDAALMKEYFGIKNYAGFGDQREDHSYGKGPAHGYIVFRIERTEDNRSTKKPLDSDAIYLLEAYRDFRPTPYDDRTQQSHNRQRFLPLCEAIRVMDYHRRDYEALSSAINAATVESHEVVVV